MAETHTIPDHAIRPKMSAEQFQFYPYPLIKPPHRWPDVKMQINRRMTLDLDLDINKEFAEKFSVSAGYNIKRVSKT